ncbi:hypothetical protein DDB_G0287451 [Dictyostelium discoideum AX4]|uniref:CWH43-like N-terminal domain-containing protein n=1 Tax=Dictyostelium discoideum TaxID=44689 RepID=Q54KE7_DICDI|nr:hypothetical protein DDB_G0287451 [Dictyostelium discoideum AX4]EAL63793.1 hypothetical protein DDB_G0287451 [Dictyostelium discoideum AX4]|eukprot:XP_637276.1 hypothetical protein DDB_G0287451 [Dictyostelium discoideum AX4]
MIKKILFFLLASITPLTLILSYILYFKQNPYENQDTVPYISDTIEYLPMATFGLAISSILSIGLYIVKFQYNRLQIKKCSPHSLVSTFSVVCLLIALIQSIGLLGVISFPQHYIRNVHLVFSAIYFIFDYNLHLNILAPKLFIFRIILSVLYTVAILIFQSTNYKEYNNLCALSEITCVTLYYLFFISFYHEYKTVVVGEDSGYISF